MDDADHLLAGLERTGHLGAEGVLDDLRAERLDDLVMDIRLEERRADLRHRLADVRLADAAASGEVAEGVVELAGETFEHGGGMVAVRSSAASLAARSRAPSRRGS